MDDDTKFGIAFGIFLGLLLTAFAFWAGGYARGEANVREEAIKTGVARWVSDADGKPKFEWIVPSEKKP